MPVTRIYALSDPRTPDVVRYIGKTSKPVAARLQEHMADARRGQQNHRCAWIRSLLSAGVRPMAFLIQEVTDSGSDAERAMIAEWRRAGAQLTNGTDGGEGAPGMPAEVIAKIVASRAWYSHTDETRRKISAAKKGKPLHKNTLAAVSRKKTQEHRDKIASAMQGKHLTERHRENLSAALRAAYAAGRKKVAQGSGERMTKLNKSRTGTPLSSTHRAKIGAASKATPRSDAWRRAISEAIKAHWEKRRGKQDRA